MNKRIEKKLEKKAELAHEEELSSSAWGRITLSYERLEEAFAEFVDTVTSELKGVRTAAQEQLKTRAKSLDEELSPQIEKLPVVGPSVARSLHGLAANMN